MMTKFKAFLALLLALTCLLSVVACSGDNGGSSSDDATQVMGESKDDPSAEASTDSSVVADPSSKVEDKYTDTDANGNAQRDPNYEPLNYDTMKGIWISQFDIPTVFSARNEKAYQQSVKRVVKAISEAGFNTIILQLRPNGDSFYPSDVYPASEFVVGAYGNDFTFDPLKTFVKIAHEYNISFHAWINPMRLMSTAKIKMIDEKYRIAKWYKENSPYISVVDNICYLVPGYEETRQLVCDGITELASRYNVDAIHIDDYFYPTMAGNFDSAHFNTVAENYLTLKEYRLEMVDGLVRKMYQAVKAVDEDLIFGISPAGSITNNLNSLYANVRKWCSTPGFCDYIAPQVYWGFEHPQNAQKFDLCCKEWEKLCTTDAVKLVIGVGIYRAKPPINAGEFQEYIDNKDVTKRQLEFLTTMDKNDGFIFYSYINMFTTTGKQQSYFKDEAANLLPVLKEFGEE